MAESVKSVLYVDYDSIHRSLKASGSSAADRLAQRAAGWVAAIESGRLVVPKGNAPTRRRMQARRCYADPVLLGKGRLAFVACGFEIIDCPTATGHQRNSAGLQIVLDAMDALAEDGPYDEFVLLSADTDLAPALQRVRAQGKAVVIYAPTDLGDDYRALSDGQVDEGLLIGLLGDDQPGATGDTDQPQPAETRRAKAPAAPAGDRNEVEALARKVNAATNVPVFAPRTFADLFRFLAQEIAERGYHFQDTAENVTAKLTEAGRSVTRRQVMFVVKGLALKGHVFSTTDTAERLAEVFREQVNYLIGSAELELDDRERDLLPAWIVGRAGADRAAPPEQKPARPRVESDDAKSARRKPTRPAGPDRETTQPRQPAAARETPPREPMAVRETPPPRTAAAREPPQPREAPPAEKPAPVPVKSIEEIRKAAATRLSPSAPPAPTPPPKPAAATRPAPPPAAKPAAPGTAKPAAAPPSARPASAQPAQKPAGSRPSPAKPQPAQPQPAPRQAARAAPAEPDKEALESSILAAIAQAVDVLVEDGSTTPPTDEEPAADLATPEPEPEATPGEGGESDDIGDEIQRIIASYSRARQQGGS